MRIILAYSGGLDTSVALHWLRRSYNAEVVAFVADIGQHESLDDVRSRASDAGASEIRIEQLTDRFLSDFALPALQAHARYEEKYLLAAPLSRPLISQRLVELAGELGADAVAHGGTGKGNDLVRFHTCVTALNSRLRVIAPLVEWNMKTREEELEYARYNRITVPAAKENLYSIDTNIWGSSIECGPLDDVTIAPPPSAWLLTSSPIDAPESPTRVSVGFRKGSPCTLNGDELVLSELVERLNEIAGQHGIGRIDILESRMIGFKSRGIYEAPAATVLMIAHAELEYLVLDRETLHHKQGFAARYGELVYYGYWFSDLRRAMDGYVKVLQERITGEVELELYKGTCTPVSRKSTESRYSMSLATYGEGDVFRHNASLGFSYVWSLPLASMQEPTSMP